MNEIVTRAISHYRERGINGLLSSSLRFIKRGGKLDTNYTEFRNDNERRWSLIESNLTGDDMTLLDIGCAHGYFTHRAATHGIHSTGIDNSEKRIIYAKRKYENANLKFEHKNISPENIRSIPSVDVTLFLTVHHHWVSSYGYDTGMEMFKVACSKCNKLFYEPPGNILLEENRQLDPDQSIEEYTNLITSISNNINIKSATLVPYSDEDGRRDPLFVLDVSCYSHDS